MLAPTTLGTRTLVEPRGAMVFLAVAVTSLVLALSAQASIELPFSPVPITLQTAAVLAAGAALGSRVGALAVIAYLAEGVSGAPVFSGGKAGIAVLAGPTGGYLVGFVAAAFVVGWLAERGWSRTAWTTAAAMVVGNLVVYAFGTAWLSTFVGVEKVWAAGVAPFIPGDLVKLVAVSGLLPAAWWLRDRLGTR
jgi:biotin transport system substrate-specific component